MSRQIYLRGAANWVCRCKFISCPGIWIVRHDMKQWLADEISQIKPRHLTISQADALVVYVYCDLRSSILSTSLEV
jgi:hypothetical protein